MSNVESQIQDYTLQAVHVPNKAEEWARLSLDYHIKLLYKGRFVLETEYYMGIANIPGYKYEKNRSVYTDRMVRKACKTGKDSTGTPIFPHAFDVLWSLVMDAGAIHYSNYEEFADAYGYDRDSRSGEKLYRECLETGLTLRNKLGQAELDRLNEVFQGY